MAWPCMSSEADDARKTAAPTITTPAPAVSGGRTVRRRDAAERVMRGMRRLVDRLTPEEVEALAGRIDEALTPPPAPFMGRY